MQLVAKEGKGRGYYTYINAIVSYAANIMLTNATTGAGTNVHCIFHFFFSFFLSLGFVSSLFFLFSLTNAALLKKKRNEKKKF